MKIDINSQEMKSKIPASRAQLGREMARVAKIIWDCGVSGPVAQPVPVSLTEVRLDFVRSATEWATFQINDQTTHCVVLRK